VEVGGAVVGSWWQLNFATNLVVQLRPTYLEDVVVLRADRERKLLERGDDVAHLVVGQLVELGRVVWGEL